MEKQEAIYTLVEAKEQMDKANTKAEVLDLLDRTGTAVGYAPAFRALVKGLEPEKSVRYSAPA